jgi:hypothetical protein
LQRCGLRRLTFHVVSEFINSIIQRDIQHPLSQNNRDNREHAQYARYQSIIPSRIIFPPSVGVYEQSQHRLIQASSQ